ncbi:MAG: hypothetical protein ACRC8S_10255 [Fimbriiglobus sp.]
MAIAAQSNPSPPSAAPPAARPPRWLRRLVAVSWVGWGAAVLSLWIQYQLGVYDTVDWLWLPFEVIGTAAGFAAFLVGLVRAIRSSRRQASLRWGLVGLCPVLLSTLLVGYMFFEQGRRRLPNTQAHKIGRTGAVSLFKTDARLRYPHRVETARLVMYHDDRVTDPSGDAVAMDAHLARLEQLLGRQQHSRIHWLRGQALGMSAMSIHSVALGSEVSPASWLDRHELAHAFLYQFSGSGSVPPMLLLEGWAMAVDGHPEPLAMTALKARKEFTQWRGTPHCLRSILAPDLYHVGTSYAYDLGGALVDFLLRRYGADKFVEFNKCIRPDSFDEDCLRTFGRGIDELEQEFWADAERNAAGEKAVGRVKGWADMLERQPVTPPIGDRPRRVARLLWALTPDEAAGLLRGEKPSRLPVLAVDVGLSVADCEQELAEVTWQLTHGMGEPPGPKP